MLSYFNIQPPKRRQLSLEYSMNFFSWINEKRNLYWLYSYRSPRYKVRALLELVRVIDDFYSALKSGSILLPTPNILSFFFCVCFFFIVPLSAIGVHVIPTSSVKNVSFANIALFTTFWSLLGHVLFFSRKPNSVRDFVLIGDYNKLFVSGIGTGLLRPLV